MKSKLQLVALSDIISTVVGGMVFLFAAVIPCVYIATATEVSDQVKTAFLGLTLGGGSIVGALIGKQQPSVLSSVEEDDISVS